MKVKQNSIFYLNFANFLKIFYIFYVCCSSAISALITLIIIIILGCSHMQNVKILTLCWPFHVVLKNNNKFWLTYSSDDNNGVKKGPRKCPLSGLIPLRPIPSLLFHCRQQFLFKFFQCLKNFSLSSTKFILNLNNWLSSKVRTWGPFLHLTAELNRTSWL